MTVRFVGALALAGLAGCSSIHSMFGSHRGDYRSAANQKAAPKLEVPPDLVQMQADERYSIPRGAATASTYGQSPAAAPGTVAVNALPDMHIERAGSERWLVVKQTPETLWPKVKAFWQNNGFKVDADLPQAGVMEAERRPAPARGLGKIFGSSTPTSERFLTRLERGADGVTEITISRLGAEGAEDGRRQAASDPGLEAAFLSRLMVALGLPEQQAGTAVANAAAQPEHARLVKDKGEQYVEVDEGFDRAWRRVSLALDRAGFTIEDRDRSQGIFYVRYLDLGPSEDKSEADPGVLARVFAGKKKKVAQRYRIVVKETGDSASRVTVLNSEGAPENSATGGRILAVVAEQLK